MRQSEPSAARMHVIDPESAKLNSEQERLLRQFENDHLDPFHTTLPLWQREQEKSIFGLLGAYDSLAIFLATMPRPEGVHEKQQWKHYDDGLMYGLRWLLQKTSDQLRVLPIADKTLFNEAGYFLLHGADYSIVADMHISLGRGLVDAVVDGDTKLVSFLPIEHHSPMSNVFLDSFQGENAKLDLMLSQLRGQAPSRGTILRMPHSLESGRIVFCDIGFNFGKDAKSIHDKIVDLSYTEFEQSVDLGSFSVADLMTFWKGLFHWSGCAGLLFVKYVKDGCAQSDCLPTQEVARDVFVDSIARLSGLSAETVGRITARLTIDPRNQKSDIFLTPLINCGDRICWSPLVVQKNNPIRNMLKSMARTPALKAIADNAIASREGPLLASFAKLLRGAGYQCEIDRELPEGQGQIDLIAWRKGVASEVLVVEAKALLDVDEINEVNAATLELLHAQEQLERVNTVLRATSVEMKRQLFRSFKWNNVHDYVPLVLTPETDPHSMYDHSKIPAISMESFSRNIGPSDMRSPRHIWNACRKRSWLNDARSKRLDHYTIKIGEISYSIPIGIVEE
ncbi:MAG: hypothetical protein IAG10_25395 [Planctomycetaceae bacterium]|nr:hypothetical protein [Planctomycetaceae bacterium]